MADILQLERSSESVRERFNCRTCGAIQAIDAWAKCGHEHDCTRCGTVYAVIGDVEGVKSMDDRQVCDVLTNA